jgi:hypothetical protein
VPHDIAWPEGKRFAFSVFDDTDLATVDNVGPVYEFLSELGVRTTKSVWALRGPGVPVLGGQTIADPDYLAWTRALQQQGFEIGSHGATYHTATREMVAESMERFFDAYGHYPSALANHAGCHESIYWGDARVSGVHRAAYLALTRFRGRGRFRGHVKGDPLYWGDICREKVRYVRNFTYRAVDTLAACPWMPYHDPQRPDVRAWFASTEGADVEMFVRALSEENQASLESSGGACIMYTHFASGFYRDRQLDDRFQRLMERLAARQGWFVPVTTLLDHLAARQGVTQLSSSQRRTLERRWLMSKLRTGPT